MNCSVTKPVKLDVIEELRVTIESIQNCVIVQL